MIMEYIIHIKDTYKVSVQTIGINFIDHVLQFRLSWILAKRPHNRTELLRCDGAITILVKQRECLFELCTTNALMYQPNLKITLYL